MRSRIRRLFLGGLALLALACTDSGTARAEEQRPAWAAELAALRVEREPLKRLERSLALLAKGPQPAQLLAELARPHPWKPDAKTGMGHWVREVAGAGELTVFVYVPTTYTSEKAWPALVWLHGGVVRETDGGGLDPLGFLREEAEARGVLLVVPSGNAASTWWSARGAAHVRGALRELATTYRVDPTRIAVAGFSDGGSGGFHLLAHDPDPYGCVISLMGNPVVTRAAGGPTFAVNCASLPVLAISGGLDPLYPGARMQPLMEELTESGARLTWVNLPEAGHSLQDLGSRMEEVWTFCGKHLRVALPPTIDWECAVPSLDGRRAWVEILEVDPAAPSAPGLESQALALPREAASRPRLGIEIDREHEGPGIKVAKVTGGTPAAEAGFQPGDILVKAGETLLGSGDEAFLVLRRYLDSLESADGSFGIQRGAATVTLTTRPRLLKQDEPAAELGYGRPSGRVVAEVKTPSRIEVRTRGVARLRLHLARPLIDTTREVLIVLNGKEAWKGLPAAEAGHVLSEALRGLPGDPLFEAQVTLKP